MDRYPGGGPAYQAESAIEQAVCHIRNKVEYDVSDYGLADNHTTTVTSGMWPRILVGRSRSACSGVTRAGCSPCPSGRASRGHRARSGRWNECQADPSALVLPRGQATSKRELRAASRRCDRGRATRKTTPGAHLRSEYKLASEELEGEITDGQPKKIDIDKMHAYRDAIRTADDQRAIRLAAIIHPGAASEESGEGLEAIAARPGTEIPTRLRSPVTAHLGYEFEINAVSAA